jgi:hypothetical protein
MTIEEYFGTLQQSVLDTWREHLKTSKHNVHVILNDFYEDMPEKVDALIEAWMSHNGKVEDYKNVLEPKDMEPIAYLEQLRTFTKEGRELMKESELESLVDDILSLIDSTLYKLKELTKTNENFKMKTLSKYINENIVNEAREISYRVQLADVLDDEDLPITITMSVEKEYQKQFEQWLENEEGNIFLHADGGKVEY